MNASLSDGLVNRFNQKIYYKKQGEKEKLIYVQKGAAGAEG